MKGFDTETIRLITLFETVTRAPVKDCIVDEETNSICFIIEDGKIGVAIGKNGNSVKNAEKITGKNIKLFESSKDLPTFVKRMIPQAIEIKVRNDVKTVVEIKVEKNNRALVIGRDGKNLKLYKEILKRNYNVDDLLVK